MNDKVRLGPSGWTLIEQLNRQQSVFAEFQKQHAVEREAVFHDRNPVYKAAASLKQYVQEFEATLDHNHEVGVRLVSFGTDFTFHAQQIGFSPPNIVTFIGVTDAGDRVQLVQHVAQLSFLLMAVKKLEEKPRRIGFV